MWNRGLIQTTGASSHQYNPATENALGGRHVVGQRRGSVKARKAERLKMKNTRYSSTSESRPSSENPSVIFYEHLSRL